MLLAVVLLTALQRHQASLYRLMRMALSHRACQDGYSMLGTYALQVAVDAIQATMWSRGRRCQGKRQAAVMCSAVDYP